MADDLDVLTYEQAKAVVGQSLSRSGSEETNIVLENAVTAVSRVLDDICGPVVIRTITDEVHYSAYGLGVITPYNQPVVAVSSITEYVTGTGTVLTAEDFDTSGTYRLSNDADIVTIRRRSGWLDTPYRGTVKLTYTAGRYADTESVDAKFKEAARQILVGSWQKYGAAWARGGDPLAEPLFFDEVTQVVNRLLWAERRVPTIA